MGVGSVVTAIAVLAAGGLTPAWAAESAGEAVAVVQSAAADGAAGSRLLDINGPVFTGDLVKTDAAGQAQLRFRDDTRMVVGPDSLLTIDSFVYAGQATATKVTINATRGVFRFITGNSPKSAYLIDTPVATIGVRGSRTDFILPGDGTMGIVFYSDRGDQTAADHGIYVCDKPELRATDRGRRHCVEMSEGCSFVVFTAGQDPRWINNLYERTTMMDTIPFAFRQGGLQAGFHVDSGACEVRDTTQPSDRDSRNETPVPTSRPREPRENCDDCPSPDD